MERYSVTVTATVEVLIDSRDLSEDEDENSLVYRALEEQHMDLRCPTINSWTKV